MAERELEKWFGSKEVPDLPTPVRTAFPRAPAHLRTICDTFDDVMRWNLDPRTKTTIVAGAKDWYTVHGDNCDLLRRSLRQMKLKVLSIASPRSAITTARTLGPDPDDRSRYLKGLGDE